MSHIPPVPREQLAGFEPVFQIAEGSMGFVPRSLFVMGRRPEILRPFAMLAGAVLGPGHARAGFEAADRVRRQQRVRVPVTVRPTRPRTPRASASRRRRSSTPSSSQALILSYPSRSAKYLRVSATTTPERPMRPTRLGSAINPFITSAKVHTRSSRATAPTTISTQKISR